MLRATVWERILEWCAEIFGMSVRSKLGQLIGYCVALFVLGLLFMSRWGPEGWLVPALLIALSAAAARQVAVARNEVWRAAAMSLEEPRQLPSRPAAFRVVAPTAASLHDLAQAVDDVRRGRYAEADESVQHVQRALLRQEEIQLLDAVRAMVSVGTGANERAAQQAAGVLPSGSTEIDACLGRTLVANAWNTPGRLVAIQEAWERAGVTSGPLFRLGTLVRIRIDGGKMDDLSTPEARELSDEARAIGDDELASELDARSKAAYR
jgi:hypothetical protein